MTPTPDGLYERLADVIHDQVMQSIGVAMLQADLCRRLWESDQDAEAALELEQLLAALDEATVSLREVMRHLREASPPPAPSRHPPARRP
jgi:glucose-6-phosphate-specific signal transduction histidine kinase